MDIKDEAVGKDGEQRGKAFDCVDEGDRDLFNGCGGENMTAELKERKRKCGGYHITTGIANAVFECWYSSS